jgi:hypothetical protein
MNKNKGSHEVMQGKGKIRLLLLCDGFVAGFFS